MSTLTKDDMSSVYRRPRVIMACVHPTPTVKCGTLCLCLHGSTLSHQSKWWRRRSVHKDPGDHAKVFRAVRKQVRADTSLPASPVAWL